MAGLGVYTANRMAANPRGGYGQPMTPSRQDRGTSKEGEHAFMSQLQ